MSEADEIINGRGGVSAIAKLDADTDEQDFGKVGLPVGDCTMSVPFA